MGRLQQLLRSEKIKRNDVLFFTFKKHIFTGMIRQGGLIWRCTWQKPGEEAMPIFTKPTSIGNRPYVRTFDSLTDWTETCIQECLDEYHTRYSSWKRVRHQGEGVTMEALFKDLQRTTMTEQKKDNDTTNEVLLQEQIAALEHHNESQSNALKKWTEWFKQNHPDAPVPIAPVDEPIPVVKEPQGPQAQPFVLTSDTGQFMVLHRMNEVAPAECVSWLKQNGAESFRELLSSVKQPVYFSPAKQGIIDYRDVTPDMAKRFVHNFFQ